MKNTTDDKNEFQFNENMGTSEKILFVAIELIAKKGYKAVTISEIARHAQVSEMTVFRHFGNKRKILEDAINRYYYPIPIDKVFQENVQWDLEKDLTMLSKTYHELMKKNVKLLHIAYKEGSSVPGLYEWVNKRPRQLKEMLMQYFAKMQEMGKLIRDVDLEMQAMMFLYINYGEILSRTFVEGHRITSIAEEDFIRASVKLFVDALTPKESRSQKSGAK